MMTEREVRGMYNARMDEYVGDLLLDVRRWGIRRITCADLFALGKVLEISSEGTDEEIARRLARYGRRSGHGAPA